MLNGSAVSSEEKVDAANMAGAAAEGLLAIRQHYFVAGELDDGGGAVPPTAAGEAACLHMLQSTLVHITVAQMQMMFSNHHMLAAHGCWRL